MAEQPLRPRAEQQVVQELQRVLFRDDVILHRGDVAEELIDARARRILDVVGHVLRIARRIGDDVRRGRAAEALGVERLREQRVERRAHEKVERFDRRELAQRRRRRERPDVLHHALQLGVDPLRFAAPFEKRAGNTVERRVRVRVRRLHAKRRRQPLREILVKEDRAAADVDAEQLLADDGDDDAVLDVLEQPLPQFLVARRIAGNGSFAWAHSHRFELRS